MQSAPVRFLIGLGYAMRSKRLRTTGLGLQLLYMAHAHFLPVVLSIINSIKLFKLLIIEEIEKYRLKAIKHSL